MNDKHRLVVSAENGAYHGWQCKLFYFSSITRLKHQPIFIVHANGRPWHPDFHDLIRAGAIVRTAPSYISGNGVPCRNCPGSLLEAAPLLCSGELIVLCDPDLVFVSRPELPSGLAGCYYPYLNYENAAVHAVARRVQLTQRAIRERQHELVGGPPYVFPIEKARDIGLAWLQAFDSFSLEDRDRDNPWLDIMYAFGLAVLKLNLRVKIFDAVNMDSPPGCRLTRKIIHYCIGDDSWDKRWYRTDDTTLKVWEPHFVPEEGTVLAELFSQMRDTPKFYRDIYGFQADRNGMR
jgi:hypothetical protein